jgi:hypothetical protein
MGTRWAWLLLTLTTLASCSELELERWDALDYELLQATLERPDGIVEQQNAPIIRDAFLDVASELDAVVEAKTLLEPLVDGVEELEPGPVQPRAVTGTNLFARVACPGRDLDDPDTTSGSGRLRVESPGKLLEAARRWRIKEDFLLIAEDCRIGPVVLNGESPGYVDPDTKVVALDVQLQFTYDDRVEARLHLPSLFAPDYYAALIAYEGRLYAINVEFSRQDTLFIRGAEGTWSCDLEDLSVPCERVVEE